MHLSVSLTAPTGRAAQRVMKQLAKLSTVLGVEPSDSGFLRDEENH